MGWWRGPNLHELISTDTDSPVGEAQDAEAVFRVAGIGAEELRVTQATELEVFEQAVAVGSFPVAGECSSDVGGEALAGEVVKEVGDFAEEGSVEVEGFLMYLANERKVSRPTVTIALCGIKFFS